MAWTKRSRAWSPLLVAVILSAFTPGGLCKGGGKGGGGGKSSGDSGDSGSSGSSGDGGSSSGGSSSGGGSTYCPPTFGAENHSLNWLDRWVGTYYNGTIDIKIRIDSSNTSCSEQDNTFAEKLEGTLGLIDKKYANGATSYGDPQNPLVVLLDGWDEGASPPEQLYAKDIPSLYSTGVGKEDLVNASIVGKVPKQVIFEILTFENLRDESTGVSSSSSTPPCEITMEKSGDGYDILGNYSTIWDATDKFLIPVPSCSGKATADFVVEQLEKDTSSFVHAEFGGPPVDYTTMTGSFSPSEVELTWTGRMQGHFLASSAEESKYTYTRNNSFYQGDFEIKFSGKVDRSRSHTMNVGGSNVTWTEDSTKTRATNELDDGRSNCKGPGSGSGSGSGSGYGQASAASQMSAASWSLGLLVVGLGALL